MARLCHIVNEIIHVAICPAVYVFSVFVMILLVKDFLFEEISSHGVIGVIIAWLFMLVTSIVSFVITAFIGSLVPFSNGIYRTKPDVIRE